jgi:hypothetical protein
MPCWDDDLLASLVLAESLESSSRAISRRGSSSRRLSLPRVPGPMRKSTKHATWIFAGIWVLTIGLQFRAIDSFTLGHGVTDFLARVARPLETPAEGDVRRLLMSGSSGTKKVVPAPWLGWALVSAGSVMMTHGYLQSRS